MAVPLLFAFEGGRLLEIIRPKVSPIMNVQFHVLGLNANRRVKEMVLPYLEQLRRQISISSAAVVLDRTRNGGPPFTVRVHLAVPGPDIHAEARDYTLQAAWRKVCTHLKKQIG